MGDVATTLVACGLQREARILAGTGIMTVAGGGDANRLEALLDAAAPHAAWIVSAGLAGGVDPALKVGDIVLATEVRTSPNAIGAAPRTQSKPIDTQQLCALLPEARIGAVYADGAAVGSVAGKGALFAATGAIAVDMESHVAARVAARHRLGFVALRVISDAAAHTLPPAAMAGMALDGSMAIRPVLASLARDPSQLPALIRTALASEIAFAGLRRIHHALVSIRVAGANLGEFPLDM